MIHDEGIYLFFLSSFGSYSLSPLLLSFLDLYILMVKHGELRNCPSVTLFASYFHVEKRINPPLRGMGQTFLYGAPSLFLLPFSFFSPFPLTSDSLSC